MNRTALLLAAAVVAVRLAFLNLTGFIFDDALITARYGAMLAQGHGLVFNPGVPSWGFTSPGWMLLSAAFAGLHVQMDLGLSLAAIACDGTLAYLVVSSLVGWPARLTFTALFAALTIFNRTAVGGMESSAFSLLAIWWWSRRSALAAALAPLVRPEGWLVVVAHAIRERTWRSLRSAIPGMVVWGGLAAYFGSLQPLSMLAKQEVYGGFGVAKAWHLLSFLVPIPWNSSPASLETAAVLGLLLVPIVIILVNGRRDPGFGLAVLALAMLAGLIAGGALPAEWYLAPIVLMLLVAVLSGMGGVLRKSVAATLIIAALVAGSYGLSRTQNESELVQETWVKASDLVRQVGAKSTFTEAVGIPGFRIGGIVWDETGIVTPEVLAIRDGTDGWYWRSIQRLKPDALIVRPALLYRNLPEAGKEAPFTGSSQVQEFLRDYVKAESFVYHKRYTPSAWVEVWFRRDFLVRRLQEKS